MVWLLISILAMKILKWYDIFKYHIKKSFQPTCPITIALKYWTRFRPISFSALELESIRPISFSVLTLKKLHLHFNKMKTTDETCKNHTAETLYLSVREKALIFLWNWNQMYHQFPIQIVFPIFSLNLKVFWFNSDSIFKTPIWWEIYQKSKPLLGRLIWSPIFAMHTGTLTKVANIR